MTCGSTLFGQGWIAFQNTTTPDTRITTNDWWLNQSGYVDGTDGWIIGLYMAPAGTADPNSSAWQLVVTSTNRTGAFRGLFTAYNPLQLPPQYLSGTTYATLVRGWDNLPGFGGFGGSSTIGSITPVGAAGPFPNVFGTGPGQVGGFQITGAIIPEAPEPSSLALIALGGIAAILFCRRPFSRS